MYFVLMVSLMLFQYEFFSPHRTQKEMFGGMTSQYTFTVIQWHLQEKIYRVMRRAQLKSKGGALEKKE